jgi:hypothetical protein
MLFWYLAPNSAQQLVLEDVVLALGERSPRFNLHVILLQKFLRLNLLMEGMRPRSGRPQVVRRCGQ